ncbi:MAG: hypothetical protein Q8N84_03805 [bacterium]|nr:hypothetical protein [bacterium]
MSANVLLVGGLILLGVLSLVFWRELTAGWDFLTEDVMTRLDWFHLRSQLPEHLGGGGGQTVELGDGEGLQFVLNPSKVQMWLMRQPVSNPRRLTEDGKPAVGAPPLIAWIFILPLGIASVSFFLWSMINFFWGLSSDLPILELTGLSVTAGLLLFPLVYWIYDWNRRHYLLVVTNLVAYIVTFQALTREYHRSPSPLSLLEEVIVDSSWSKTTNFVTRAIGGWLNEKFGIGDAFMGTRVMGAADVLTAFPWITSIVEIFQFLNRAAKEHQQLRDIYHKMANELRVRAQATTQFAGLTKAGERTTAGDFVAQADSIIKAWRDAHPSKHRLNMVDPAILGYTRWDLQTGEELPNPPPPPYLP